MSSDTSAELDNDSVSPVTSPPCSPVVTGSSPAAASTMKHLGADSEHATPISMGAADAAQFFATTHPFQDVVGPSCPPRRFTTPVTEADSAPIAGQTAEETAPSHGFPQVPLGLSLFGAASHSMGASSIRKGGNPCQNFQEIAPANTSTILAAEVKANSRKDGNPGISNQDQSTDSTQTQRGEQSQVSHWPLPRDSTRPRAG